MKGKQREDIKNKRLREFWDLWNYWWKHRTAPTPNFYELPRRKRDILAKFTELFELQTMAIQQGILNKKL